MLGANTTAVQMAAPVWKLLDQPLYLLTFCVVFTTKTRSNALTQERVSTVERGSLLVACVASKLHGVDHLM